MSKIGESHLSAMGRQGLRELRAALYPESNVAQPAEYGLYGTMTPGEVAESRRGEVPSLEQELPASNSVVDARIQAARERAKEPEPVGREPDRG